SRGLLALVSGIAHYAVMAALGVPYAAVLAVWAGVVSQFIPVIGTYLGGAVPVLIALTVTPATALWMLLFVLGYQQLENYLLQPRITARTVDVHPAVAFGLILAGAAVAGPIGVLLAIPLGASIQAFASVFVRRYDVEDHPLTRPDPPGGHWWRWLRRECPGGDPPPSPAPVTAVPAGIGRTRPRRRRRRSLPWTGPPPEVSVREEP